MFKRKATKEDLNRVERAIENLQESRYYQKARLDETANLFLQTFDKKTLNKKVKRCNGEKVTVKYMLEVVIDP